ncbi:hypothetical protein NEAUS04_1665 [Nematocida ausubeli]|nr:hypothetical protein NEAUS04_1665 [Nematocida ausubeli]
MRIRLLILGLRLYSVSAVGIEEKEKNLNMIKESFESAIESHAQMKDRMQVMTAGYKQLYKSRTSEFSKFDEKSNKIEKIVSEIEQKIEHCSSIKSSGNALSNRNSAETEEYTTNQEYSTDEEYTTAGEEEYVTGDEDGNERKKSNHHVPSRESIDCNENFLNTLAASITNLERELSPLRSTYVHYMKKCLNYKSTEKTTLYKMCLAGCPFAETLVYFGVLKSKNEYSSWQAQPSNLNFLKDEFNSRVDIARIRKFCKELWQNTQIKRIPLVEALDEGYSTILGGMFKSDRISKEKICQILDDYNNIYAGLPIEKDSLSSTDIVNILAFKVHLSGVDKKVYSASNRFCNAIINTIEYMIKTNNLARAKINIKSMAGLCQSLMHGREFNNSADSAVHIEVEDSMFNKVCKLTRDLRTIDVYTNESICMYLAMHPAYHLLKIIDVTTEKIESKDSYRVCIKIAPIHSIRRKSTAPISPMLMLLVDAQSIEFTSPENTPKNLADLIKRLSDGLKLPYCSQV